MWHVKKDVVFVLCTLGILEELARITILPIIIYMILKTNKEQHPHM